MSRFLAQESTVTASCYTVEVSSAKVHGFHYCTTLGAGESRHHHPVILPYQFPSILIVFPRHRSTVVSLRSPQGLKQPTQDLPWSMPRPAAHPAGPETTGPSLKPKGRQRTPFRKSVRGSSVTHYPRPSLVRGSTSDRSHWEWVRSNRLSQFNTTAMHRSRNGSRCGTTAAMLSTAAL